MPHSWLYKLADEEHHQFLLASQFIESDFYVDDLLTSSDTCENAMKLRDDINNLLQLVGYTLRKCSSNDPEWINALTNH